MHYRSIEEANVADAAGHLADAKRMNDPAKIQLARSHLREQLELIRQARPDLYEQYANNLN